MGKGEHTQVTAIWFPPADLPANTNVAFRATVVKVKPEFWSLKQVLTVQPTSIHSASFKQGHSRQDMLSHHHITTLKSSAIRTYNISLLTNYEYFQKDFRNSMYYLI